MELIAKEKEVEQKHNEEAQRHAASLRQQVKEQELLAAEKRRERLKEADRMFEEDRQRNLRLLEVKERKLQELKWVRLGHGFLSYALLLCLRVKCVSND